MLSVLASNVSTMFLSLWTVAAAVQCFVITAAMFLQYFVITPAIVQTADFNSKQTTRISVQLFKMAKSWQRSSPSTSGPSSQYRRRPLLMTQSKKQGRRNRLRTNGALFCMSGDIKFPSKYLWSQMRL